MSNLLDDLYQKDTQTRIATGGARGIDPTIVEKTREAELSDMGQKAAVQAGMAENMRQNRVEEGLQKDYMKQEKLAQGLETASFLGTTVLGSQEGAKPAVANYGLRNDGLRNDGTPKGDGFLGVQKMTDGSGRDMTEYAIGINIGGKETEIPTLVPTLTKDELGHLLAGKGTTPEITRKAVEHAKMRMSQGKSPFAESGEQPLNIKPVYLSDVLFDVKLYTKDPTTGKYQWNTPLFDRIWAAFK